MIAWHFLSADGKLRDSNTPPPDGVPLVYAGKLFICHSGLHASLQPFDALQFAPGPVLCLVRCGGEIIHQSDKLVCSERTILCRWDATEMLRYYARMQALSVGHLWDMPDVVADYMMTGEESLRDAARAAAWAAARDAAMDAAWAAAMDAAWAAARASARDAARDAFNALVYECFEGPLEAIK